MEFSFKPIEYNCKDELVPKYLDRIGRGSDAFLSERLLGSEFWEITAAGRPAGFLAMRGDVLTGFYMDADKYYAADGAFCAALRDLKVYTAEIASFDSPFIALSSPHWTGARVDSHCYEFSEFSSPPRTGPSSMRCAGLSDEEELMNTGYFQRGTLQAMTAEHSVYVCREGGMFVAFGTIEPVRFRDGAALVGAYVADGCRHLGYGCAVLCHMTGVCLDYHIRPLALCGGGNRAFAAALQRAGYVSFDKFLRVNLA